MRGIIISKMINITRFGLTMQSEFDPQNLRSWVLHWDRIDHPIGGGFPRRTSPEEDFLIAEGVMQRTLARDDYLTTDQAQPQNGGIYDSVLETFAKLEAEQPGQWAIGRTALPKSPWDNLDPPKTSVNTDVGRGLAIRLVSALPVPNVDVPLEEVLAFKAKRSSELESLRAHLDSLYQSVLAAPDKPLAEVAAIEAVSKSASDILRSGPTFQWKLVDLSGNFNFLQAGSAFIAAQSVGLGLLPSAIAAVATSTIEVGPSFGMKERSSNSPFEYVAKYHSELFSDR